MKRTIASWLGLGLIFAPLPAKAAADPAASLQAIAGGHPVSESDLDSYRGGETIVAGSQTLSAVTTGNVLNGNFTAGAVSFSGDALSNFNGIGNFAINTGAQVSLQSGLNLTINVGQ